MTNLHFEILNASLGVMVRGPAPLGLALETAPRLANITGSLTVSELLDLLKTASPDDPVRNRFRSSLIAWDYDEHGSWHDGSLRNTDERRARIYSLLGLMPPFIEFLESALPYARLDPIITVSDRFTQWFSDDRKNSRNYYWSAYKTYLGSVRNFDPANLEMLDEATDRVVERLTDPEQLDSYRSKGLVVGYVQSGKTANFTGVIAKAMDAGYRLIIVLSGTMDLLRDQTQRRVDMELVGKELIRLHAGEGDRFDYDDDPDWELKFLSHGGRPSEMGAFDILRLTGAGQLKGSIGDYTSLKNGIQTLEIEKVDKGKPLFDPSNLHAAAARMMVVKKNGARLKKLVGDLRKIGPKALSEVPALIIDDESDQATINTIHPNKQFLESERRRRTAINRLVTDLIELLPRAQYVGYTATPFASVFVDPDDTVGTFPKDFIVSLPRPAGYMGVRDFHDFDLLVEEELDPAKSNEKAHVRGVWKPHDESTDLLVRALDTFVLTGAIKIYRDKRGSRGDYRHHTMLVHESVHQSDHEQLAILINRLWASGGYDGGKGMSRLRDILRQDIQVVSAARGSTLPMPETIDEIRPELGEAVRRIEAEGRPVLVVNGTKEADTPDFDKIPVWKVVVGGAKLSRGYTIEGLTVSYFRRRATYQDTLMQMGRWFGFRPGYRDLVRLFIGRHEPLTSAMKSFIDLYEAFGAMCLDEEAFREQLLQYVIPEDGSEPLTPLQVLPLVQNSHPQLVPVAKNRMFHADLRSKNFGGNWVERTLCSDEDGDLQYNATLFEKLLGESDRSLFDLEVDVGGLRTKVSAFTALIPADRMIDVLSAYRWAKPHTSSLLKLELDFLRGGLGDPEIEDWILLMPQLQRSSRLPWQVAGETFTTVERARIDGGGRFKAFTVPYHRLMAEVLTGVSAGEPVNGPTRDLHRELKRGALLLYPTYPKIEEQVQQPTIPAMGFAFLPPRNSLPRRIVFGVKTKAQMDTAQQTNF